MSELFQLFLMIWGIGFSYSLGYTLSFHARNGNSATFTDIFLIIIGWPILLGVMHSEDKQ